MSGNFRVVLRPCLCVSGTQAIARKKNLIRKDTFEESQVYDLGPSATRETENLAEDSTCKGRLPASKGCSSSTISYSAFKWLIKQVFAPLPTRRGQPVREISIGGKKNQRVENDQVNRMLPLRAT